MRQGVRPLSSKPAPQIGRERKSPTVVEAVVRAESDYAVAAVASPEPSRHQMRRIGRPPPADHAVLGSDLVALFVRRCDQWERHEAHAFINRSGVKTPPTLRVTSGQRRGEGSRGGEFSPPLR
jgi:hypothetical protein